MVYIDWTKIAEIVPENLGEDEKEDLLESVTWYTPTADITKKQLISLLRIIQEIMKYKVEQVESLMSALDELATKQGEEVARGRQDLMEEIQELRENIDYQKRHEMETGFSDEQMRSELVRLETQNDELVFELQEREKDLIAEKAQVERLTDHLGRLERERTELTRELESCREESSDQRRDSGSVSGMPEKVEELVELVRQKNRHIMQLLDDIESLESDNSALRVKLTNARSDLSHANSSISELTSQIERLNVKVVDAEMKQQEEEAENKALSAQIEELIERRHKHERDLDEFAIKLDDRVEEWKRLLDAKDQEIRKLREESASTFLLRDVQIDKNATEQNYQEHDRKIYQYKEEIRKLEADKSEQNKIIENLKERLLNLENSKVQDEIRDLNEKLSLALKQVATLEAEAVVKGKEISEVVSQLRAYERGEFGLSDATDAIRKLERKLGEKEVQFEALVEDCNRLEEEKGNLEDENILLKEKLGYSPTHMFQTPGPTSKTRTIFELKGAIAELSNEIVELKLKTRNMSKKGHEKVEDISETTEQPIITSQIEEKWKDKYDQAIGENDALRKGLHDVLKSIQCQGMGEIEATSLVRLLEALDARHVSGWYHPAMRLQAQINTMQGEDNELRNRINELTKENNLLYHKLEEIRATMAKSVAESVSPTNQKNEKNNDIKEDAEFQQEKMEYEETLIKVQLSFEKKEASWDRERRALIREINSLHERGGTIDCENKSIECGISAQEAWNYDEQELESQLLDVQERFFKFREELTLENIELKKDKLLLELKIRQFEEERSQLMAESSQLAISNELSRLRVKYNQAVSELACAKSSPFETNLSSFRKALLLLKDDLIEIKVLIKNREDYPDSLNFDKNNPPENFKHLGNVMCSVEEKMDKFSASLGERIQIDSQVEDLQLFIKKLQENLLELEHQMKSETIDAVNESMEWRATYEKSLIERNSLEEYLNLYKSLCRSMQVSSREFDVRSLMSHSEDKNQPAHSRDLNSNDCLKTLTDELLFRHLKILYSHLNRLHSTCQNALCFPNLDQASKIMERLEAREKELNETILRVEQKEKDVNAKENVLEIQLDELQQLKNAFSSDTASLITWHNTSTKLKLNNAFQNQKIDLLHEKVHRLESQMEGCREEITLMEEDALVKEQKWLAAQREWETMQVELVELLQNKSGQIIKKIEDKSVPHELENQMELLKRENAELKTELKQKDVVFTEILATQTRRNSPAGSDSAKGTKSSFQQLDDSTMGGTVSNLQALLAEKEEQIVRYQQLVKRSKEEYSETTRRLQQELRNVHAALAQQSRAYSRLKHSEYQPAQVDIEKYVTKVQELEEELNEAHSYSKRLSGELAINIQEAQRWQLVASDLEKTHTRMESEILRLQDELSSCQIEAKKVRAGSIGDNVLMNKINELQVLLTKQNEPQELPTRLPEVQEERRDINQSPTERLLRASQEECERLRSQIAGSRLKAIKTKAYSARSADQQENLVSKIRKLEETLELTKRHEKELEEIGLKRIRSVEEVTRWDERKRNQKVLERLKAALKQKEIETDVANKKLETLKGLMSKIERDRNLLEVQVQNLSESARGKQALDKMIEERAQLKAHIAGLEDELMKLAHIQAGAPTIEVEEIRKAMTHMKRRNIDLERENLSLKERIEKYQVESRKMDLIKRSNQKSAGHSYEIQRELDKTKDKLEKLNDRMKKLAERNSELEVEVENLKSQLKLWEDKDYANSQEETRKQRVICQLEQELNHLKAELGQKVHLLGRVKVLLRTAAAKEKALNEKVSALQSKQVDFLS